MNECPVHDKWRFDKDCICPAERKWARDKMLQESLEKLVPKADKASRNG